MPTSWLDILATLPTMENDGDTITFGEQPADYAVLACHPCIMPLPDRAVLQVEGADVDKLLQGQLTCDMNQLPVGGTLPGALCEVKGRMISNFFATRPQADQVLLVMPKGVIASTMATLKKYAPFYKVAITDVSNDYLALGINQWQPADSELFAGSLCLTIPPETALLLVPAESGQAQWQALQTHYAPAGSGLWQYLNIRAGLAEVVAQTQEEFIPQMLNLQHTGAVNFRKGCYTGQEIVARMQYLGKLKRRMYRLQVESNQLLAPGTAINSGDKSAIGTVVMAQMSGQNQQEILAVLVHEAADAHQLRFGETELAVTNLPLPYDDQFVVATR